MSTQKLFRIGDVAKLFHLSVSSLRHYESIGLLLPEHIDPHTGYRYYSTRQFEALNTIRYLRALDMPLGEISDFLENRDIDKMEQKLQQQKETVEEKLAELQRVERKIDNRLRQIRNARASKLDVIEAKTIPPCRMVWMETPLTIDSYLDMELPIRKLEQEQAETAIFLGKVGVSIAAENLRASKFDRYDGIFLLLDDEEIFDGESMHLPETPCVSVRFRGSHTEAPQQYRKLMSYLRKHNLEASGFSREITMIDYGITNDPEKFVTEISIPIASA